MARVDRVIARRAESKRRQHMIWRNGERVLSAPQHRQGGKWWRNRLADLVERRVVDRRAGYGHSRVTYVARSGQ